jgi:plasmid stability protein
MGQVLIRNLDDELIAAYREAAERNNRSLEAELRAALGLHRPITAKRRQVLRKLSDAIRAMTPRNVVQTPSELLVREDRDGFRD